MQAVLQGCQGLSAHVYFNEELRESCSRLWREIRIYKCSLPGQRREGRKEGRMEGRRDRGGEGWKEGK